MNYKKIFYKFWKIGEQDNVICDYCKCRLAVDIHHIKYRSQGGKDEVENLIALCREDHEKAHKKEIPAKELFEIIKRKICFWKMKNKNY